MLRIHTERYPDRVVLRLEGKLVQPWVDELGRVWMELSRDPRAPGGACVDLRDVSFVDPLGLAMLAFLRHQGCQLIGSGPFITGLIEEIDASRLPHGTTHAE